ncbi:MAG: hypothetical protein ACFBSC_13060 [Microcoleaceae cyanobacterium]
MKSSKHETQKERYRINQYHHERRRMIERHLSEVVFILSVFSIFLPTIIGFRSSFSCERLETNYTICTEEKYRHDKLLHENRFRLKDAELISESREDSEGDEYYVYKVYAISFQNDSVLFSTSRDEDNAKEDELAFKELLDNSRNSLSIFQGSRVADLMIGLALFPLWFYLLMGSVRCLLLPLLFKIDLMIMKLLSKT